MRGEKGEGGAELAALRLRGKEEKKNTWILELQKVPLSSHCQASLESWSA